METLTQTGTITWFEIAKNGLPPSFSINELCKYSENVLVTNGQMVEVTKYAYSHSGTEVGWFGPPLNNPTHWAYINQPKK